jgi:hypothetical protein
MCHKNISYNLFKDFYCIVVLWKEENRNISIFFFTCSNLPYALETLKKKRISNPMANQVFVSSFETKLKM